MLFYQYINVVLRREDLGRIKKDTTTAKTRIDRLGRLTGHVRRSWMPADLASCHDYEVV